MVFSVTQFKGLSMPLGKFWESASRMMESTIARLPSLILSVVVFLLFCALSAVFSRVIRRSMRGHRENLGIVFGRLFGWATMLLGFLVAISIVAPSFQTVDLIKILGIGGVAIGFAFQNILQNFLAGLLLLWSEPFRIGDEIKLDTYEGRVEEIQTRATIIKTYDERRVVIPNADLFTHAVVVNTAWGRRRWQCEVSVKKNSSLRELKTLITDEVRKTPGVLSNPAPEVLVTDVSPETFKLRVLWSTRDTHQHDMLTSYDSVLTAVSGVLQMVEEQTEHAPVGQEPISATSQ